MAVLAGASFGADASMCPVMCRSVSSEHQATLYSIAKVGGLITSTVWISYAGLQAEHYAAGLPNCVGEQCYHSMWVFMLAITLPALCTTALWALGSAKHKKVH